MPRPNLGGRKTAVEGRLRRRRRSRNGEPREPVELDNPIGRYVRNIPVEDPFRYNELTHASDLIYKCMRMVALAGDMKVPVPTEPNWQSMKLIHAMGHASAEYVTNTVLAQSDNVFGYWKCACGVTREGPHRKQDINHYCESCNQPVDIYDELTLINEEYGIIGNCDLAFMEDGFLIPTELKSISKKQFDNLTDAKPDHKLQALLYWWMSREAGFNVHPTLSVFYSCREWMIGNPFKEFVIPTDNVDRRVRDLLDEAMEIKEWKHGGAIPERRHCNVPEAPRAKKCGMCTECFIR